MAALLVTLAVMSIVLSVALPVWRQQMRREKEAELIFRGEQYARALDLFQRKFPGALPPNVDVLVEQKFLRRKYKDPITNDDFEVLYQTSAPSSSPPAPPGTPRSRVTTPGSPGASGAAQPGRSTPGPQGGVVGVVSKSKERALRRYKGRDRYNEWVFQFTAVTRQPGAVPGGVAPQPGQPRVPRPPGSPPRPGEIPRPGPPSPRLEPPQGPGETPGSGRGSFVAPPRPPG